MARKAKFIGELARRIRTMPAATHADILAQRFEKVPALLRHYGWKGQELASLNVGDLMVFIMLMASDYVPGFQTGRDAGRPKAELDPKFLWAAAELAKRLDPGVTDEQACETIAESLEPGLAKQPAALEQRGRTLAKRVAGARASARRKAGAH